MADKRREAKRDWDVKHENLPECPAGRNKKLPWLPCLPCLALTDFYIWRSFYSNSEYADCGSDWLSPDMMAGSAAAPSSPPLAARRDESVLFSFRASGTSACLWLVWPGLGPGQVRPRHSDCTPVWTIWAITATLTSHHTSDMGLELCWDDTDRHQAQGIATTLSGFGNLKGLESFFFFYLKNTIKLTI